VCHTKQDQNTHPQPPPNPETKSRKQRVVIQSINQNEKRGGVSEKYKTRKQDRRPLIILRYVNRREALKSMETEQT